MADALIPFRLPFRQPRSDFMEAHLLDLLAPVT